MTKLTVSRRSRVGTFTATQDFLMEWAKLLYRETFIVALNSCYRIVISRSVTKWKHFLKEVKLNRFEIEASF